MGRQGDVYVRIYTADGKIMGEYIENGTVVSTEQLGGSRASVSVTAPGGAVYDISGSKELYVSFNRATGGLRLFQDTAPAGAFPTATMSGTAEIVVTAGSKIYTVEIISSTGRHGVS